MSFPANYNIRYYEGDLYQFVIRPKDSAGDPFPISSATHDAYFYVSTARGGSASATLIKRGTDAWVAVGDLAV